MGQTKELVKDSIKGQGKDLTPTKSTIFDLIKSQEDAFRKRLPKYIDAQTFTHTLVTVIQDNKKLQQCEPKSLLGAMMVSAQLGLEPNTPMQEAAIIPYGPKAQFQPMYRGMLKLMWNSGEISNIDYDKICENDEYTYVKGFEAQFEHKPNLKGDRGPAFAYYAIARMKDGSNAMVLMNKKEIEDHGKRYSKAYTKQDSPWRTAFDQMAIKTVLIQLVSKKLPKSTTKDMTRLMKATQDEVTAEFDFEKDHLDIDEDLNPEMEIEPDEEEEVVEEAETVEDEKKPEKATPAKAKTVKKDESYLDTASALRDEIVEAGGKSHYITEILHKHTGDMELSDDIPAAAKKKVLKNLQELLESLK